MDCPLCESGMLCDVHDAEMIEANVLRTLGEVSPAMEIWGADECGVCGEHLKPTDSDIAEMVDPDTSEHVIGHWMCGQSKGFDLA